MTYAEIARHPEFLALCKNKNSCSAENVRKIERKALRKLALILELEVAFLEHITDRDKVRQWDEISNYFSLEHSQEEKRTK